MYHPVPHGFDQSKHLLRFEPIQQKTDCRKVIGGADCAGAVRLSGSVVKGQIRAAQTDAIHFFPSSSRLSGSRPSYRANRMLDEPPFIVSREYGSRRVSKVLAYVNNSTRLGEPFS